MVCVVQIGRLIELGGVVVASTKTAALVQTSPSCPPCSADAISMSLIAPVRIPFSPSPYSSSSKENRISPAGEPVTSPDAYAGLRPTSPFRLCFFFCSSSSPFINLN